MIMHLNIIIHYQNQSRYKAKKYLSYFANGKRTSRCLYSIAGNVSKIVEDSDDANISQITLDNCHWYNNCLK